jgi:hypothetical protein
MHTFGDRSWRCRHCYQLTYATQVVPRHRHVIKVQKIREKGPVGCTAAQAVAAALLASGMGNTVKASGRRPRLRSIGNSVLC